MQDIYSALPGASAEAGTAAAARDVACTATLAPQASEPGPSASFEVSQAPQQSHPQQQQQTQHPQGTLEGCARPELAAQVRQHYVDVCANGWMSDAQLPIVYSPRYNITFMGLEKLHPFDSCKFKKVLAALISQGHIANEQHVVMPKEASLELLKDVHTDEYLHQIHYHNLKIVKVTELAPLFMLPNPLLRRAVISPMKHHVAGTVLAAGLALQRGWAVNLGGGMHHAYASDGMGWCPFDDIMLAVRRLRAASGGGVQRVMVIDLDAHQGNGLARDKLLFKDDDLFILDMYNAQVFPRHDTAKAGIGLGVPLRSGTTTQPYLDKLVGALEAAAQAFPSPDLVVYNAGTDVLEGDPLGRLAVSREGIKQRDLMVWQYAQQLQAPIVMLLSGGYARDNASVISDSLANIMTQLRLS